MIRINLLQIREELRRAAIRSYLILTGAMIFTVFVIVYSVHSGITSDIETTKADNIRLNAEITKVKKIIGEVEKIKAQKTDLEGKLSTIHKLGLDRKYQVEVVNELVSILPPETWFTSITVIDNSIHVKGRSVDNQYVSQFIRAMQESLFFKSFIFGPSTQEEGPGGLKVFLFDIEARLVELTAANYISDEDLEAARQ